MLTISDADEDYIEIFEEGCSPSRTSRLFRWLFLDLVCNHWNSDI